MCKNIMTLDINDCLAKGRGYIAQVDVFFPTNISEKLRDFPLAPYNSEVKSSQLSVGQRAQYKRVYGKDCPKILKGKKMLADFNEKQSYVVHHSYIKKMKELGAIILKVHKGASPLFHGHSPNIND